MQRPTLRQLEYFVAVAKHLSFRQAAEACFVSQPALSEQIAQLESLLRVKLFERGRKVSITSAGLALLDRATDILTSSDQLVETATSLGDPLTGPLRLGTIPTVGPYLLPAIVPGIHAAHPKLELYLSENRTEDLLEELADGRLDVLLLDIDVDLGKVETHLLFSDPFLVALSSADELAAAPSLPLSKLDDRNVLLLDEGHCLREQTLPLCKRVGLSENTGFRGSSLGTIVQMVASGLGFTLMPEMAVEREKAAAAGLAVIPLEDDIVGRSIGLAWRKSSPRAEEYRQLGATITAAYAAS